MVKLHKPVSRVTVRHFAHYKKPIVITLVPGTDRRDDFIAMRLKGTRGYYLARVADVFRLMAMWHGSKLANAKRAARKEGIPWRQAKKAFDHQNAIA